MWRRAFALSLFLSVAALGQDTLEGEVRTWENQVSLRAGAKSHQLDGKSAMVEALRALALRQVTIRVGPLDEHRLRFVYELDQVEGQPPADHKVTVLPRARDGDALRVSIELSGSERPLEAPAVGPGTAALALLEGRTVIVTGFALPEAFVALEVPRSEGYAEGRVKLGPNGERWLLANTGVTWRLLGDRNYPAEGKPVRVEGQVLARLETHREVYVTRVIELDSLPARTDRSVNQALGEVR